MMFAVRNLRRNSLRTISSLVFLNNASRNVMTVTNECRKLGLDSSLIEANFQVQDASFTSMKLCNYFYGARCFSAKSMRSKVERRMRKESGKTLREIRRAKKLRKKLMTDEERLLYNLRRAKKKVALLLQKLKKYELPELPPPRHDPELLTPEQLQAFKKIGFRNRNYVPVGVRGVFGGVVQNMHLHWKFHETVQVCCDNFPKEKIKEMASMLARLSGGIVINIHNVKTIIMFRGRNYRQPKNLIPINTLTKRKALFKARFEQALESQKLNIKKIEQELRRKGVNPEDPVAMASIQRVASTFFNAIDQKEGSPYVFREDKTTQVDSSSTLEQSQSAEDSDQEELDRFIAEIEDAADKEWAAEEAAEEEELGKIRYWNQEDIGGRSRRSKQIGSEDSDDDIRERTSSWNNTNGRKRINVSDGDEWTSNDIEELSNYETDAEDPGTRHNKFNVHKVVKGKPGNVGRTAKRESFNRNENAKSFARKAVEDSVSEDMLSDLEDAMWESDDGEGHNVKECGVPGYDYRSSSSDEENCSPEKGDGKNTIGMTERVPIVDHSSQRTRGFSVSRSSKLRNGRTGGNNKEDLQRHNAFLDDLFGESDAEENDGSVSSRSTEPAKRNANSNINTSKELDETWDSD